MRMYLHLLRLQLLLSTSFFRPRNLLNAVKSRRWQPLVALIAGLGLIGYVVYGFLSYGRDIADAIFKFGMLDLLLSLSVLVGTMTALVLSLSHSLASLYFNKDIQTMAVLPVSSRTVYSAKLTESWLWEAFAFLLLLLSFSVLYASKAKVDFWFYPRAALIAILMPLCPLAIGALFVALAAKLASYFRSRESLILLFSMAGTLLILVLQSNMTMNTLNHDSEKGLLLFFLNIRRVVEHLLSLFPPMIWGFKALKGSIPDLAYLALTSALSMGAVILLLGGSYQLQALRQAEGKGRKKHAAVQKYKGKIRSPFRTLFLREWGEITRTPVYALNIILPAFMPQLIAAVVLGILFFKQRTSSTIDSVNMIQSFSMLINEVKLNINDNTRYIFVLVYTAVFSMGGMINAAAATAISREGTQKHRILSSLPIRIDSLMYAKMLPTIFFNLVSDLSLFALFGLIFPMLLTELALALAYALLMMLTVAGLSLSVDLLKPQFVWKNETAVIKRNLNVIIAMLLGLAYVYAGVSFIRWILSLSLRGLPFFGAMGLFFLVSALLANGLMLGLAKSRYLKFEA